MYRHKKRDLSKRRNKFSIINEKENVSSNVSRSNSSRRSASKQSEVISSDPKKNKDLEISSSEDAFETYVPERDPKNKARYLPPSRLRKAPTHYQGRRVVKFKETNEYSEEQFGSLKREKKPAPRKIMCVTEIMADISDTESGGDSEPASNDSALRLSSQNSTQNNSSSNPSTAGSDIPIARLPDKMAFLIEFRKRSQKRREKETEEKKENKLSEDLINRIHNSKNIFKMPFTKPLQEDQYNRRLESMIFRKFNNKKSVNKIIQKTAKLQKNLADQNQGSYIEDDTTGDAIRYCMAQRIKSLQLARAENSHLANKETNSPSGTNNPYAKLKNADDGTSKVKTRKRGKIDNKFIKLKFQECDKSKRKTTNFHLYDQNELEFIDANNLLNKRLHEFEFDNDINSDEDEIAKSAYVRLKDLTVCLKQTLNKGNILDNDRDDQAIKKHVGLPLDSQF